MSCMLLATLALINLEISYLQSGPGSSVTLSGQSVFPEAHMMNTSFASHHSVGLYCHFNLQHCHRKKISLGSLELYLHLCHLSSSSPPEMQTFCNPLKQTKLSLFCIYLLQAYQPIFYLCTYMVRAIYMRSVWTISSQLL